MSKNNPTRFDAARQFLKALLSKAEEDDVIMIMFESDFEKLVFNEELESSIRIQQLIKRKRLQVVLATSKQRLISFHIDKDGGLMPLRPDFHLITKEELKNAKKARNA